MIAKRNEEVFIHLPAKAANCSIANIFAGLYNIVINTECDPEIEITQQGNGPDDYSETWRGYNEVHSQLDFYSKGGFKILAGCNNIFIAMKLRKNK